MVCFDASRSQFSRELEIADNYLFDQGLHPVFGIVQDGVVTTMTPQEFVDKLCDRGKLPKPLYNLLQFTIEDGDELLQHGGQHGVVTSRVSLADQSFFTSRQDVEQRALCCAAEAARANR